MARISGEGSGKALIRPQVPWTGVQRPTNRAKSGPVVHKPGSRICTPLVQVAVPHLQGTAVITALPSVVLQAGAHVSVAA